MSARREAPRLAVWLLNRCRVDDGLLGDLVEQFARGRSLIWFWTEALAIIGARMWRTALETKRSALTGALYGCLAFWLFGTAASQAMLRIGWLPHAVDWRGPHYVVLLVSGFICTAAAGWIVARVHREHPLAALLGFSGFVMTAPLWKLPLLARIYPEVFSASIQPHLTFFVLSTVLVGPMSIVLGGRIDGRRTRSRTTRVMLLLALLAVSPSAIAAQSAAAQGAGVTPDLADLARRGQLRATTRKVSELTDRSHSNLRGRGRPEPDSGHACVNPPHRRSPSCDASSTNHPADAAGCA